MLSPALQNISFTSSNQPSQWLIVLNNNVQLVDIYNSSVAFMNVMDTCDCSWRPRARAFSSRLPRKNNQRNTSQTTRSRSSGPLTTRLKTSGKVGIFSNQWWITKTNDCKIWHEILLWRYVPQEVQAASYFHSAHWLLRIWCRLMLIDAFWVTLPTKSIKVPYNSLAIKKRQKRKKVNRNLLLAKRSLSDENENKITVWIY